MEVLLQTAQVTLFNPHSPTDTASVRVVMDTSSQHSYLTDRVKNRLSLTAVETQKLSIMTFGSTTKSHEQYDCVKVGMKLRSGANMYLTMFTVLTICESIREEPVAYYQQLYTHLSGLELADSSTESSSHEVDVLVGSDFYLDLITGQIRRGAVGPIAIHTKLGWVLSGPTSKAARLLRLQENLMN